MNDYEITLPARVSEHRPQHPVAVSLAGPVQLHHLTIKYILRAPAGFVQWIGR